jgi:hypothetical protein
MGSVRPSGAILRGCAAFTYAKNVYTSWQHCSFFPLFYAEDRSLEMERTLKFYTFFVEFLQKNHPRLEVFQVEIDFCPWQE